MVIAFGAALNMWTTRHGALVAPGATVIQVDRDEEAIGAHRPVDLGVVGDARETAEALIAALAPGATPPASAARRTSRSRRRSRPAAGATSRTSELARLARSARR